MFSDFISVALICVNLFSACEFFGLIGGIFGLMSINTMATIAIDRYMAIGRPIHATKKMTRKKAFLMIVTVWIWSLSSSLPPLFGWGRYIPEGFQTSCTFDYLTRTDNNRSYIFFLYIFGFAVPLGIIIVSYGLIIRAVRNHEQEMKTTAKKMNAELRTNQEERKMEIKVAKISMTILVLYLLSWLPYATVALIGQFGDAMFVTPYWSEIPVIFAKASAMHNPIVYALSHPKFRAAVSRRLPWLLCCCEAPPEPVTTTQTRDNHASRRSQSSVTGACSISSEMSHLEGNYANIELRLRALEDQTGNTRRRATVGESVEQSKGSEIQAGKIIQDLTHVLLEVASRDKPQIRPVYLPSNVLRDKTEGGGNVSRGAETKDGLFVLDQNTLPELVHYIAEYSNTISTGGISNPALDATPEIECKSVVEDRNLGARAKTRAQSESEVAL